MPSTAWDSLLCHSRRARSDPLPLTGLRGSLSPRIEADSNLGVITGKRSGDLVDIDLDDPTALELADRFLPSTGVITGRPSAPRSQRWYTSLMRSIRSGQFLNAALFFNSVRTGIKRWSGRQSILAASNAINSGEHLRMLTPIF